MIFSKPSYLGVECNTVLERFFRMHRYSRVVFVVGHEVVLLFRRHVSGQRIHASDSLDYRVHTLQRYPLVTAIVNTIIILWAPTDDTNFFLNFISFFNYCSLLRWLLLFSFLLSANRTNIRPPNSLRTKGFSTRTFWGGIYNIM